MTTTTLEHPAATQPFTVQEMALGHDMLTQRAGEAVLGFVVQADGTRMHMNSEFGDQDFERLVNQFRQDPKETLAHARQDLFAIGADTRLAEHSRKNRLGRYLDAYTSMTLRLDHAAFPVDKPGVVHKGVPDYLPDGFIDMGSDDTIDEKSRTREQITLDKADVFKKYRSEMMEIFSRPDIIAADTDTKKKLINTALMQMIFYKMPYALDTEGKPDNKWGGGKVKLSELDEGQCRHHAFAFQTLAQAFGVTSRLFKNTLWRNMPDGSWKRMGSHAANLVRINKQWYVADVTQPDLIDNGDGTTTWSPGVFKIDGSPQQNNAATYEGQLKYRGVKKRYQARTESYWRIERE